MYSTCVIDISLSYKVKYPLYTMECTWEKLINKQPLLIPNRRRTQDGKQTKKTTTLTSGMAATHNRMLTKTLRK